MYVCKTHKNSQEKSQKKKKKEKNLVSPHFPLYLAEI
jgi:hypothetical protein